MNNKLFAFLLSAALLTSCSQKNDVIRVDVTSVSEQTISRSCVLSGTVAYASESEIIKTTAAGCTVDKIVAGVGEYVKAGDPICVLNTSASVLEAETLKAKLSESDIKTASETERCQAAVDHAKESMETELAHIEAEKNKYSSRLNEYKEQYSQMKSDYEYLVSEAERLKELFDSADNSTDIEHYSQQYSTALEKADMKETTLESYKAKVDALEASLIQTEYSYNKAKADGELAVSRAEYELKQVGADTSGEDKLRLEELERLISDNTVRATSDGYITNLFVTEGSVLSDGKIAEVNSSDRLCVKLTVPDEYILSISDGTKVVFSSSSMNNTEYSGEIHKVSNYRGDSGFSAEVSIDNADELIAGMTVSVTVALDNKTVPAVPSDALHKDQDGKSYVYTASETGDNMYKIAKTAVSVGINNTEYAEIRSDEITPDTFIIVSDAKFEEGQLVCVNQEEDTDGSN